MCCGSGSSLIAALRIGYPVAGFDNNKTQVDAAKSRVAKFAQQVRDASALDREYMEAFDSDEESAEIESDHDDQATMIHRTMSDTALCYSIGELDQ
ncbi:hypothetical protein WJX77_009248 [Trebouxia sp. C0004]